MERISATIESAYGITKQTLRRSSAIDLVRTARNQGQQDLGYSSRPFVLTSLPVRRLPSQQQKFERRNGRFWLQLIKHPDFALPFGQDRLIPIWVATLAIRQRSREVSFSSAAQILDTFGLPKGGAQYRRLIQGFERIFAATIFFGTDGDRRKAKVIDWGRFHFFDHLRLWYSPDVDQETLPGCANTIRLSEAFWTELQRHPLPIDLQVVRALKDSPACLDFYCWLSWRSWTARAPVEIQLLGENGLVQQFGSQAYSRDREYRRQVARLLGRVKLLWPQCPARLTADRQSLRIQPQTTEAAVLPATPRR